MTSTKKVKTYIIIKVKTINTKKGFKQKGDSFETGDVSDERIKLWEKAGIITTEAGALKMKKDLEVAREKIANSVQEIEVAKNELKEKEDELNEAAHKIKEDQASLDQEIADMKVEKEAFVAEKEELAAEKEAFEKLKNKK